MKNLILRVRVTLNNVMFRIGLARYRKGTARIISGTATDHGGPGGVSQS